MKKVCIVIFTLIALLITLKISHVDISYVDIVIFILLIYVVDQICFFLGKYIELRREREKFELIIRKIERQLQCQKNIQ